MTENLRQVLADGEALLRRLAANERTRAKRRRKFVTIETELYIGADGIRRTKTMMIPRTTAEKALRR